MDKYYVLDITGDIESLEKDMSDWSNLPYEFRMRGNDECIRRYGVTNIELYNKLKYKILYNKAPKNSDIEAVGSNVSESVSYKDIHFEEESDYVLRLKMAEELNRYHLNAIISPDINDINTLEDIYRKYLLLDDTYRRFSNSYSINLFGFNVPNMYSIMKDRILTSQTDINGEPDQITVGAAVSESVIENGALMQPVVDEIDKLITDDDKIGLLKLKLMSYDESINPVDKALYDKLNKSIDKYMSTDIVSEVSNILPNTWFTPSELRDMNIEPIVDLKESYRQTVTNALYENDTNRVLHLGWNPEVPINDKSIKYAKQRQIEWLKENVPVSVDISNIISTGTYSPEMIMNNLYRKFNLYPIFLIVNSAFNIFDRPSIRSKYKEVSQVGLSFDPDMRNIYTFKHNSHGNEFKSDSLSNYLRQSDKSRITVTVLFIDGASKEILDELINHGYDAMENTLKYGFNNILNIFFNKQSDDDKESSTIICAQFVDALLKMIDINIAGKHNSLVVPHDFVNTPNPKVYKVYDGLAKKFTAYEINSKIYDLFKSTAQTTDLLYKNYIQEMLSNKYNLASYNATIIDNIEANDVLSEIRDLLTPQAAIQERLLPIIVKPDGSISIRLMKTLEREYQEAHRLLITYNEDNLAGIKHELARLFYVELVIEKKLEKMPKDGSPKRKLLIDLRARVLNDFKKYMKVVLAQEKDFDFEAYFKESEYNDAIITFDKGILKLIGDILRYIFTGKTSNS